MSRPTTTPQPTPRSRWKTDFADLTQALARANGPRSWFAEGAIENTPLVLLAGPEKKGKSWILADLVLCAIAGGKWLDRFPVLRTGSVLVLDGEYGEEEYARRLARLARGRGLDPAAVVSPEKLKYLYSPHVRLEGGNPDLENLWGDIKAGLDPVLVVVDPIRNHMAGDENNARDVLKALGYLAKFRDTARCPLIASHHLNKVGGYSGSRAFSSRADMVIEGSDEESPWYSTIGRTVRASDPIKKGFTVVIQHIDDEDDARAKTVLGCRLSGEGGAAKMAWSKPTRRVLEILEAASSPVSMRSIRDVTKQNHTECKKCLDELQGAGIVELRNGKWQIETGAFFKKLSGPSGDEE